MKQSQVKKKSIKPIMSPILATEESPPLSARYEAILAAVPNIIMEVNKNKVYTWANQAGLNFFGPDVVGKEAAFYFEGDQDTLQIVEPLFHGEEDLVYVENWQRRHDGIKRLLAWRCRTLRNLDGNIIGALSSAQDITERNEMEKELECQFRFFQMLFDLLPFPVFCKNKDGIYTICNKAYEDFMNIDRDQFIGKSVYDISPKELSGLYLTLPNANVQSKLSRRARLNCVNSTSPKISSSPLFHTI